MKKIKYLLVALLFIFNINYVNALDNNEVVEESSLGLVVSKKDAEVVIDQEKKEEDGDSRTSEVTITIDGIPFTEKTYKEVNISLVIDYSSSMVNNETTITIEKVDGICPSGTKEINNKCQKTVSRLDSAKYSAKELAKTFLASNGNFYISLSIFDEAGEVTSLLTNDLEKINKAIDNISTTGRGTNIQDGINKGSSTLTNSDTEKVLILLSDGEPYDYTYNKKEISNNNKKDVTYYYDGDNDSDYEYSFKNNAENATKAAADYYRKNITFYTIGFNTLVNGSNLLKYIAGSDDRFISASDGDTLLQAFLTTAENIKNQYVIGTNAILEDIIPEEFILDEQDNLKDIYGNNIKIEEGKTTKITYEIGDITNTTKTFSYKIKAKDDYHGSIYTNETASLTFNKVTNNPYNYDLDNNFILNDNGTYTFVLNKPSVIVPAVTKDDNLGNVLTTKALNIATDKLLNNDSNSNFSLGTISDESKSVVDTIIIVSNPQFGTLEKTTSGYKYIPNVNDNKNDSFTYRIKTEVTLNDNSKEVVYSNVSKVNINLIKEETKYVIHHYLKDTTKTIIDDEIYNGYVNEEVSGNAKINLSDYVLADNEPLTKKIILKDSDNEIIFYYEKNIGKLTVKYITTSGKSLADDIVTYDVINNSYNTSKLDFNGYKLIKVDGIENGKYKKEDSVVTYLYQFNDPIPNTGINKTYTEEILFISSVLLLVSFIVIKKIIKIKNNG